MNEADIKLIKSWVRNPRKFVIEALRLEEKGHTLSGQQEMALDELQKLVTAKIKLSEGKRLTEERAVCNMLLDGLTPDKVEKARLTEISIAYGTLFDKRQLLTGGATQNIGISAIIKAAHGLNGNIGGNTAKGTTD